MGIVHEPRNGICAELKLFGTVSLDSFNVACRAPVWLEQFVLAESYKELPKRPGRNLALRLRWQF
jgi:hypothetical protein